MAQPALLHQMRDGGRSLLCQLRVSCWSEALALLDESRPDCNVVDEDGNGSLHLVAREAPAGLAAQLIERLLAQGADPMLRNKRGQTPLHLVQLAEPSPIASPLLEAGADMEARDHEGRTWLARMLVFRPDNDTSTLQRILDLGARPDVRSAGGRTMLCDVVRDGSDRVQPRFDFLVAAGVDARAVDDEGNTLFHEAALANVTRLETLDVISQAGVDLDQANRAGRTPLHQLCALGADMAVGCAASGYVSWLLARTSKLDAQDRHGLTPLHLASATDENMVDRLLAAGADVGAASADGLTALHVAARARQSNIVGRLVTPFSTAGPDEAAPRGLADVRDKNGRTPLHHACRSGRPETVAILLSAGADPRETDTRGMTALEACVEFEDEQGLWDGYRRLTPTEHAILRDGSHHHLFSIPDYDVGARVGDMSRPFVRSGRAISQRFGALTILGVRTCQDTTRLEEILDMIFRRSVESGEDAEWLAEAASRSIERSTRQGLQYTSTCFRQLQARVKQESQAADDMSQGRCLGQLLVDRKYAEVEKLFHRGTSFLEVDAQSHETKLHVLVKHGFATLVEKLGALEAEAQFREGKWHAVDDASRPGLGHCSDASFDAVDPLLHTACRRELPNMDVVRVLVEKLRVDPDARDAEKLEEDDWEETHKVGGDSALHRLALGRHWWHVAQGIPYLSARAEVDARNCSGQTPLHVALDSYDTFATQAARALVDHGADVNAVDHRGNSCLSLAARESPELLSLLLAKGAAVSPADLFSSFQGRNPDVVDRLLAAGADPNASIDSGADDWLPEDEIDLAADSREYDFVKPQKYPLMLQYAAMMSPLRSDDRDKLTASVKVLLDHGADPYALFSQAVKPRVPYLVPSLFPGEIEADEHKEGTPLRDSREAEEGDDVSAPPLNSSEPWENIAKDEDEDGGEEEDEDSCEDVHVYGEDDSGTDNRPDQPEGPRNFARRSTIHAVLEDGGLVQPFLERADLDLEHRNPAGRTLLLSACRSALGADAAASGTIHDAHWSSSTGRHTHDPFLEAGAPSAVQILLSRGADGLAADKAGKTALHHLLEAHDVVATTSAHPPLIRRTLRDLAQRYPALVNRPDSEGTSPLHAALQRLRRRHEQQRDQHARLAELQGCADDLLAAGADPLARDGRANSALHYLADGLAERVGADEQRRLFRAFLDKGLDVNARNGAGRTPAEILLRDDSERTEARERWLGPHELDGLPRPEDVDEEVLDWLGDAGLRWAETDVRGRSLLHVVARSESRNFGRGRFKFLWLVGRGVDPALKDGEGMTAFDVAARCQNQSILGLFDSKGGFKGTGE